MIKVANTAPNSKHHPDELLRLLYISLTFGFSLAVNAFVWFRVSGGLFNPAITLGAFLSGAVPLVRSLLVIIAQLLAAVAASFAVLTMFPGKLAVQTTLSSGTSVTQGFFIEMFLTFQLLTSITMRTFSCNVDRYTIRQTSRY